MVKKRWDISINKKRWDISIDTKKTKRKQVSKGSTKDIYVRAGGKCERCKLSLRGLRGHIHHKNRKPSDNRLSNLILLCPNCHSEIHKKDKPPNNNKPNEKDGSPFDLRPIKWPKIKL